jgi:hypothetical protein
LIQQYGIKVVEFSGIIFPSSAVCAKFAHTKFSSNSWSSNMFFSTFYLAIWCGIEQKIRKGVLWNYLFILFQYV